MKKKIMLKFRTFHNSCLLNSGANEKDPLFDADYKELSQRIENLDLSTNTQDTNISGSNDTLITDSEAMLQSLSEFKKEINKNIIDEELKEINDYFDSTSDTPSFEESFPNYVYNKTKSNITEISEDVQSVEEINNIITDIKAGPFEITKEISKLMDSCNGDIECMRNIPLTDLIKNIQKNSSNADLEEKVKTAVVEQLSLIDKIGNITLRDIYANFEYYKQFVNIDPNYLRVVTPFITYGLMVKSYNKYHYSIKPSPHLSLLDTQRWYANRVRDKRIFTLAIAPMVVIFLSSMTKNVSLININLPNTSETSNIAQSGLGLFFIPNWFNKLNKYVKYTIMLIISYLFVSNKYIGPYIQKLEIFVINNAFYISIPSILLVIGIILFKIYTLYLMRRIENFGKLPLNSSISFIKNHYSFLNETKDNQELFNLYKHLYNKQLKTYIIVLILYVIILSIL